METPFSDAKDLGKIPMGQIWSDQILYTDRLYQVTAYGGQRGVVRVTWYILNFRAPNNIFEKVKATVV